ncbi:hypothetical protein N9Z12_02300 [Opitutaceae bacterium]|nr:hypothetical protein [bacterium]MDB4384862.1 hypothetical protein [Opitutaceae bacterium]
MPDQDRLQQLRKQRANIVEQLAWLDEEIANAGGEPESAQQPVGEPEPAEQPVGKSEPAEQPAGEKLKLRPTTPVPAPVQLESDNPAPAVTANPEAVLEEWMESDGAKSQPVSKKGCWLVFFALAAVGILAATFVFKFFY